MNARGLAKQLEVSTPKVYRDVDKLSTAGVPVIVERGATGGFELLGWRTTLTGLTPNEAGPPCLAARAASGERRCRRAAACG